MSHPLSRRDFLKISGGAAAGAGAAIAGVTATDAEAAPSIDVGRSTLPYKPKVLGKAKSLPVNTAQSFNYPDASSPCAMIKTGAAVPGGVGPEQDIVAYSILCSHMGCPVAYDQQKRIFKCPCHFSIFDAEKSGQMVCGQATENLPQIVLQYNVKDDTVTAVAVNGLIYGRQSNIL